MAEAAPRRTTFARLLDHLARVPGAAWGLLALAIGMVLGSLFPAQLAWISFGVGKGFGSLAKAAPYIIFFTIAAAIIDMLSTGKAGRFALWVSLVFTGLGLVAGLLSILLVVPLLGLSWGFGGSDIASTLKAVGLQTLLLTHSSPSFIAVFYAAFCAVMLNLGKKWRLRRLAAFESGVSRNAFRRGYDSFALGLGRVCVATMDVTRMVGVDGMRLVGKGLKLAFPYLLLGIGIYVPTAIGTAIAASESRLGGAARLETAFGSSPIALYFLTLWVQLVVLAIFMAALIIGVCYFARFPIKTFFKEYFLYVYPFAWGTSSSAASIPVNLERTGTGLKVRKEVREFIIPLGATVNLDGAIMACFVITAMASMIVGYRPTFIDLLILLIPIKIVTLGVPGIPGGIAAVVPPVVAEILPLPVDPTGTTQATFLAIWFAFSVGLSDQFRTGVNTTTNGLVSLGFETVYDKYFSRKGSADVKPAPLASELEP